MINDLVASGVPDAIAAEVAPCFLDRLSDSEVAAILAAESDPERSAILDEMDDRDGANACVLEVMGDS